jgi:hypothetical protein
LSVFSKARWSVKDKLDREALEGIVGFFQVAYLTYGLFLLTSSTLLYVRLTSLHNQIR